MKTRILIAIIFASMGMAIYAQTADQEQQVIKRYSFGAGYSRLSILDEYVSPYTFKSDNAPFYFRYSLEKEKTLFEYNFNGIVGFSFKPHDNEYDAEDLSSSIIFQQQAYVRYFYELGEFFSGKLNLYLGGEVREQFFTSFADAPTFSFGELGINLSFLLTYQINSEHSLRTYIGMPVVGTRVNFPNANMAGILENGPDDPFSEAEFTLVTPWLQRGANCSIEWFRQLSEEWSIACEYSVYGYRMEEMSKVNFRTNGVIMKLSRTF